MVDAAKTASVNFSLPDEVPEMPLGDGGHQVPVDVAVRDIEAVRAKQEHEDPSETSVSLSKPTSERAEEILMAATSRVATALRGVS